MVIDAEFQCVEQYKGEEELLIPKRATAGSAGYDFVVAADTIVPAMERQFYEFEKRYTAYVKERFQSFEDYKQTETEDGSLSLDRLKQFCKLWKIKPTLVPTGVKARMPRDYYLQLSVRSSLPLNDWLILANGVGIIDSDYYNNPDNEGHIFFQLINLHPADIILHKGDRIGQGVFLPYYTVNSENTVRDERTGGFGSTNG